MGQAPRGKRRRREGAGGGREVAETEIYTPPTLQAFLICERVDTAQDGVHSLYRIVDRFNVRLEVHGPEGAPIPQINVPLNFILFARFGAGVGRFRASFELSDPDGQSIATIGDQWFWLRARESAQNVITTVSMPVAKNGPYKALANLNGVLVGEYVFIVELQQLFVPTGPPNP